MGARSQMRIAEELANLGYDVGSVHELRNSGQRYADAIPLLLRALEESEDIREKESLVRALSVPWAKPAALKPLIEEFKRHPICDDMQIFYLRWAIGNAFEVLWDDSYFDELTNLALDSQYGREREMIVLGMGRSKRPEAGDMLIGLLHDPEVNGHAVQALAKLKLPRARPGLERMTSDERAWVRRAAKRGLAKLE